jgi:hypothetical protein
MKKKIMIDVTRLDWRGNDEIVWAYQNDETTNRKLFVFSSQEIFY